MTTVKRSKLKKTIIAIEARRSKHPDAPRLKLSQDPKLQRIRQARDKLLVESLQAAGLDTCKIAALGEQHDAALRRATDKYRAEAIRRSRKKGTHYSSVMGQCKAIRDAADDTTSVSLPKPFLIWATPRSNILSDSQIAPSDSWAKFRISSSGNDSHKVSFYFLWTNPFANGVFIDPFAFVIATGYLHADADRSYLTPKIANVSAQAEFFLWQWWLPAPAPILSASSFLGGVSAIAEYFQTDSKSQSVSAGVKLDAGSFFVTSYSTALFEVAISISFDSNNEGTALADFESGNFNVTCPLVAFSVVQSPF
jgi:hypothetical protein